LLRRQHGAKLLLVEKTYRVRLAGLALVAVANVFPALPAIGPNMVLNESGKVGWKGGVELPAVNPAGEVLNHPQTPVLREAPGPIGVVELVKA